MLSDFEKRKSQYSTLVKRKLKAAKKFIDKCHRQLEEASQWRKEQHLADLLGANLFLLKKGMKEVRLADWEKNGQEILIPLDPSLKPHEEVAQRYKKSRKAKKAEEPLKKLLHEALNKQVHVAEMQARLAEVETEEDLNVFITFYQFQEPQTKHRALVKEPPKPYLEFLSDARLPIWVGKSAANNDLLTFQWAHGNDYWLHAMGIPGSHVVIHSGSNEVDEETLQDAIQLALYYSKAKMSGKGEVCVTQKKHVSKLGVSGKVQVAKQKVYFVKLDEERIKKITLRRRETGTQHL